MRRSQRDGMPKPNGGRHTTLRKIANGASGAALGSWCASFLAVTNHRASERNTARHAPAPYATAAFVCRRRAMQSMARPAANRKTIPGMAQFNTKPRSMIACRCGSPGR